MCHELVILRQIIFSDSVGEKVFKGGELFVIRLVPNVVSHEAYRQGVIGVGIRYIPASTNVDESITAELREQNFN